MNYLNYLMFYLETCHLLAQGLYLNMKQISTKKIEYYKKSTPGITGIWQVSGRDEVKYKRRVAMDILYYKKGCLYFDLFILLKTPAVVFKMSGVN